jgi:virginiamycin B lyase
VFAIKKSILLSSVNVVLGLLLPVFLFHFQYAYPQLGDQTLTKDMITYSKQSNFIKEFKIPNNIQELGLKGITVDLEGNVWFYHATNKTSTVIKFNPQNENFTQYDVKGKTVVDNAIVNLAGGQLIFDSQRSIVWFTDARTNSIGKLDTRDGKIELVNIPTPNSGPMGITLSPNGKSIWFTEITGNKISSLDVESNRIFEYPTGEESGPTFLSFDSAGMLWVTQSYSNNVLQLQPWMLVPNSNTSMGMSTITLPQPDRFSPFGIAVANTGDHSSKMQKASLFVSDHSSSRVIVSTLTANDTASNILESYTSYWTSPSKRYPATLPSQIVIDKSAENVYFPQHGGNRISKINIHSGIMTEYDIPTGPLSTAVFIAVSYDGKRVWFTEWASNKIAYLDTTTKIPLNFELEDQNENISTPIDIKTNQPKTLDVRLNALEKNNNSSVTSSFMSSPVSLTEIEMAVVGMTDLGLKGVTYDAEPQRVDMEKNSTAESKINLNLVQQGNRNNAPIELDQYTLMVKASVPEKDQLFVSLLTPIMVKLDLPEVTKRGDDVQKSGEENQGWIREFGDLSVRNIIRVSAISAAVGLIGYIVYMRIKKSKEPKKLKS